MIINIVRKRFTWNIMKINFKTKEAYSIYFQFSLKDPWIFPKHEPHFGKTDISLYGWLFFYFGRQTEGILYETTDKNAKIVDKKDNKYWLFTIKEREMRDKVRESIKNKAMFDVKEIINKDGTKNLKLIVYQ